MQRRLIALHGFTMNGAELRRQMGHLGERLAEQVELIFPDAPHTCSAESVARMYSARPQIRIPEPALMWWSASADGRTYEGWEESFAQLRSLLTEGDPPIVFGFSQGAIFAATIAALSAAGQAPPLEAVVLVAGQTPRATALRSWFTGTVAVPSLHVWGTRDLLMGQRPAELADHFDAERVIWSGPHAVPAVGPAADVILRFVQLHR